MGLAISFICLSYTSSGERPPCMQIIRSSIRAHAGMQLKQSTKAFQILVLYRALPKWLEKYIIRRSHRCGWLRPIRGCLWGYGLSKGAVSLRRIAGRLFQCPAFLCPHNLPRTDSKTLEASHHTRKVWAYRSIAHGCLHRLSKGLWVRGALAKTKRFLWQSLLSLVSRLLSAEPFCQAYLFWPKAGFWWLMGYRFVFLR